MSRQLDAGRELVGRELPSAVEPSLRFLRVTLPLRDEPQRVMRPWLFRPVAEDIEQLRACLLEPARLVKREPALEEGDLPSNFGIVVATEEPCRATCEFKAALEPFAMRFVILQAIYVEIGGPNEEIKVVRPGRERFFVSEA